MPFAEKQNLEKRTFFPRFKRPANGGVISWNKPAAEISALVQGIKFWQSSESTRRCENVVENEFFIISELEILNTKAESAPGTINKIGARFFTNIYRRQ